MSQKTKYIPTSINLWCYKQTLFLFFSLRSHSQSCTEQQQQILLPQFCLCTWMKDTAGQRLSSAPDAIPILTRLDVFNTLCRSESNWWELRLGGGKGEISTTSCTILLFSLSAPVKCKGRRTKRESKLCEKRWSSPTDRERLTCPELCFPLVEAKLFAGSQPQRNGNCRTASKHYRRRSPSAMRHIERKTAQPKSQGLTAPFQFS